MGARQQALMNILSATEASGRVTPVPKSEDFSGNVREQLETVYHDLGGILPGLPVMRFRSWDMAFNGAAIELDEELHFNRYWELTLRAPLYDLLPSFPLHAYRSYSRECESACLRAGSYGGKWTNRSCEKQFGPAGDHGDLTVAGAPRWKQRAFYDLIKDTYGLVTGLPVVRIAIWDAVNVNGSPLTVAELLDRRTTDARAALVELVESRTTS